jgi:hypothetical protein
MASAQAAAPRQAGEIRIITDMDDTIFSAAGCSCSAGDDQPY